MVDDKKNDVTPEENLQKIGAKSIDVPPATPPAKKVTGVERRLDVSMKAYSPVNRSSDLVPLTHEFHCLRKQLRDLIWTKLECSFL
jgi:hypothetical protein